MKKQILITGILFLLVLTIAVSCKKEDTTGIVKGTITAVTSGEALGDVRIIVFDSQTNSPIGSTVLSASDGTFSIELDPGTYYLNLSKQAYQKIPSIGVSPVSFTVELENETVRDYQMQTSSVTNGGLISGTVSNGTNGISGVLVIAETGSTGASSVTADDGTYTIYNVPAGSYTVKGYIFDYNSDEINVTVTANTESTENNITLIQGVSGSVTGAVTFLATDNGVVDVTLTHPITKETIPGLSTTTVDAGAYTIPKVPNGIYIARASYSNDTYVVDPDWIVKNGEPEVTVNNNTVTLPFSVTGAVTLTSPTNAMTTTVPVEITTAVPTFTWVAYASTNDYVIEVSDINGNVIWGGFTKEGSTITKNIIIPKAQLSIEFNSDGNATSTLKTNTIYRWRIYASKDAVGDPGWQLISSSEDQQGLFIIL